MGGKTEGEGKKGLPRGGERGEMQRGVKSGKEERTCLQTPLTHELKEARFWFGLFPSKERQGLCYVGCQKTNLQGGRSGGT